MKKTLFKIGILFVEFVYGLAILCVIILIIFLIIGLIVL